MLTSNIVCTNQGIFYIKKSGIEFHRLCQSHLILCAFTQNQATFLKAILTNFLTIKFTNVGLCMSCNSGNTHFEANSEVCAPWVYIFHYLLHSHSYIRNIRVCNLYRMNIRSTELYTKGEEAPTIDSWWQGKKHQLLIAGDSTIIFKSVPVWIYRYLTIVIYETENKASVGKRISTQTCAGVEYLIICCICTNSARCFTLSTVRGVRYDWF